ncbi:mitochondrial carrier domain-containing protein [Stachybotrys elegans]|uniref:Mitochondrial carrier domain-containing protein n=1 Tax=Stachybotrys elegans TaxID=80388 RepID=A0A8K0SL85_9HYPO|nr:mitochondrial carrier domain-containing protein [Stachybotrys elegans]
MATIQQAPAVVAVQNATSGAKLAEKKKHKISPALSLFAGGVAGAVEASITYPFEFAKTRAQLGGSQNSRNPFSVIATTVRQDGVRAVYTGCTTLILGTTFKAGVRFLSFDSIRNMLMDEQGKLSPARGILAGMIAGTVESVVAVTPTERVKTALIDDAKSGNRQFRGGTHALSHMIKTRGISEVYRGLVSTTLKQSATSAVRMGSYNVIKEYTKTNNIPQNTLTTFASGAIAGTITVYATQPFDTIKTMAQSAKGAGTMEALTKVVTERGVRALWSGSTMRLGRLVMSGGIVFSVYEFVAGMLSR